MPENENIATYPEEPTNPSGYEGFEKSVYYILSLLRYMYYSKVESDNKYVPKSGGTITGSVTIQGNLVVNGQSYSIDTENLKVGDYTITLAKDNEQTLTSMVGMVVPKYDGTNYGFFGWDADGYAYVGDLTNYDGTSAITLANNSSLQRISTIDTTNTVVASNGVIYVYDATSHCFKKPTNDNKYYVIRNGAFVETELFTEQKSKNIDNALYNVGTFDTISGNTITRQSWTITDLSKYNLAVSDLNAYSGVCTQMSIDFTTQDFVSNVLIADDNWVSTLYHAKYSSGKLFFNIPLQTSNDNAIAYTLGLGITLTYQLASSYTENIIPNQPLLNLDSNGCNFLREEWEKGLNLFNINDLNFGTYLTKSGNSFTLDANYGYPNSVLKKNINWKANIQYTFSGIKSNTTGGVRIDIKYTDGSLQTIATDVLGAFVITSESGKTISDLICDYSTSGSTTYTDFMIVEGTHTYPYQEYNGAIVREKDIEPVLLWENSSPSSAYTSTGSSNAISIPTLSNYKYLIIKYKAYQSFVGGQYVKCDNLVDGRCYLSSNEDGYLGRSMNINSTTTLYFNAAYSKGTADNTYVIPLAIYGTNVL